jgi:integrase
VQVDRLFAGWRQELATCRKFAPAARNYAACRLLAEVGLRVNEACKLDLGDIKWDLGRFGKLHAVTARAPAVPGLASGWCH